MSKIALIPSERWLISWFAAIPYDKKIKIWKVLNNEDD